MTNLEKCNEGIEYSYADEELIALKTEAIRQCEIFNAIDGRDYMAQYRHLQQMLGAVGERVWIAKPHHPRHPRGLYRQPCDDWAEHADYHRRASPIAQRAQGISRLGQARAHRQ